MERIVLIIRGSAWIGRGLKEASIMVGADGRIAAILGRDATLPVSQTLETGESLILPGGIDMHAHTQDGAETFYSGTCAAAAGGITTVVDMPPFHTCTTRAGCQARRDLAEKECVIDFALGGGIVVSLEDLAELGEVARFGAPYFKVFMPSEPPVDTHLLWACVQAAARTGLRLALHAEEMACVEARVDWGDPLGFPHSRPVVAETSATAQVLEMARAAGAPVHICHVSAGRTTELIDAYRGWGVDVTSETTPHFLIFDESEFIRQGARVKTTPPLRTRADCDLLWQALAAGVVDAVVSDHYLGELPQAGQPQRSMQETEAGIAGLELSLPLLYDAGVVQGRLTLERFVEVTTHRPAEVLGLASHKGSLAVGMDADLVLFDPRAIWQAVPTTPFSRLAASPYEGRTLQGAVSATIVRGNVVWDGSAIRAERGWGRMAIP
jgi:allantoinase